MWVIEMYENGKIKESDFLNLYAQCVELMDDGIRELVHAELSPCAEILFLKAYCKAHKIKFNEYFDLN